MSSHALPEAIGDDARATRTTTLRRLAARAARFARTERGIVTIALGAVGLHIADDNYF
jgi:hypothetical protein